tara:strand:+ start:1677 stop:2426 length:750 start_codon:yes stop_codon:yes gene_type:complete
MTTTEFNNEFDLGYDNASKGAPGLDMYEKSVLLTQAQEQIVKEAYSGYTPNRVSFEGSEKRRRQLSELVRDYKTISEITKFGGKPNTVDMSLIDSSQLFALPLDLMYIILEKVTLEGSSSQVTVKPVTHDEYNVNIGNPFKQPNKRRAWRLDLFKAGAIQQAELFAIGTITQYQIRYVKKPVPIILANFESEAELQGLGLTVDGINNQTECELNTEIHRDILLRAIDLAVLQERENVLANRINTNKMTI